MQIALRPNPQFLPPRGITVRILAISDLSLLEEHLTNLDDKGRHDRFNGSIGVEGLADYARRCIHPGALILAAESLGHVVGIAELHPATMNSAECAFSVDPAWRGRGVGTALFALLVEAAWSRGLSSLVITTHSENEPMKALARRFGTELFFSHGEGTGRIDLQSVQFGS